MRSLRRPVALVVPLVLLIGACTTTADTTTSSSSTTSPATTTSTVETTTTAPERTTTVPETTTTTLLEGNWADMPLITSGYGTLGWWDGAKWVQVHSDTVLPVSGGEEYQVVGIGSNTDRMVGVSILLYCNIGDGFETPGVGFETDDEQRPFPDFDGLAISAPWVLTPHLVELRADDGTYAGFASELLDDLGTEVERPHIKQLIRLDLEGDGVEEVLVVAEEKNLDLYIDHPGHYSIAFLRRVVDEEVTTWVLDSSTYDDGTIPLSFVVSAIADLNGDGQMEIALDWAYYEGSGVNVWELESDEAGPVERVGQGCGV